MALLRCATEIHGRITSHVLCAESLDGIIHSHRAFQEKAQVKDLKDKLKITQKKSGEMITAVQEREANISDQFTRLESYMEEMRIQLNHMQNKLELTQSQQSTELMKMKSDLHTGQTAYNFEYDLACYIYPPGKFSTYDRRIFSNLMKWLRENRDTHEGEEANKRWNDLVDEFGWTDQHKPVFFKMLEYRKDAAHPPLINLGLPISDRFNDHEKKMVEDIRQMAVELKKRLSGNR